MHTALTKSGKLSGETKSETLERAPVFPPAERESESFPLIRAAVRQVRSIAGLNDPQTPQAQNPQLEMPKPIAPKVEEAKPVQRKETIPEPRALTEWQDLSQSLHVSRHVQLVALLVAGTERSAADAALRDPHVLAHIPELKVLKPSSDSTMEIDFTKAEKVRKEISGILNRLEKEVDATPEKSEAGTRTLSLIRDVKKIIHENDSSSSSLRGVLSFEPQVAKDILERLNTHLKAQPEGFRFREDGMIPIDSDQSGTLKDAGWLAEGVSTEDVNVRGLQITSALRRAFGQEK